MNKHDTSTRDEHISAMLDDQLEPQELHALMQDLKRDPEADAERVQRYQIIGDVLRDDLSAASFMDISAAVHRAIDQEPELNMAPKQARAPLFNFSAWIKPLTGMAIAASVAMITVASFRAVEIDSVNNPVQAVADAQVESTKAAVLPLNTVDTNQLRLVSTLAAKTKTELQAKQLSDYLMLHSGSAGQATMQGMMPYVRVVGFDTQLQK